MRKAIEVLRRLLYAVLMAVLPRKMLGDKRAMVIADSIINIVLGLFVLGSVGVSAIIMATNLTAYGSSVPDTVKTLWAVAIPVVAGVGVMMVFVSRRKG